MFRVEGYDSIVQKHPQKICHLTTSLFCFKASQKLFGSVGWVFFLFSVLSIPCGLG